MALTKKQFNEIKEHLDESRNPLYFFDDDQDGLCSFLLLYRHKREGHGIVVKTSARLSQLFARKIDEYRPDKIFIMDIADVEQDFIDKVNVPVIWIDHHGPYERENIKYYNPRVSDIKDNQPTSYLCYNAVNSDLWIATLGCIADWYIPDFINEFRKAYPGLIDAKFKNPGDIIYNTKLGHLIRIFSFILKGQHSDVMKCVKILTRIKGPFEILDRKTEQAEFLYKRYESVLSQYEPLLKEMLETLHSSREKIVVFPYKDDKMSLTSDLSNEAIYKHPDRIIIVAREKNDEMKCSLRSSKMNLPPLIEKSLVGLKGYGGGHENACGVNVSKADFEEFLERLKRMV